MSPQSASEQKPPTYHLPEVPEYRHKKFANGAFYRAAYTFICLVAVLAIVGGVLWGVSRGAATVVGFISTKTATATVPPTPTRTPVDLTTEETALLEASCPDTGLLALPSLEPTQPTLDFCAPKYYSNVAGPVGSHLTLIAQGISAQPEKWALVNLLKQPWPKNVKNLQACIEQKTKCFPLPSPDTKNHLPAFSLYSWTWQTPQFPTDMSDYYIVAFSTKSTQLLWSSISFTLNSPLAPCISISVIKNATTATSGDCTQKRDFWLAPGATITISGSNWILQNLLGQQSTQATIQIAISCKAKAKCAPSKLPIPSSTPIGADGSFNLKYDVPTDASGVYSVTALCQVMQIATPGLSPTSKANINTVINGSLTFGDPNDATGLTLHIGANPASTQTQNPNPTPTPSGHV